MGLGVETIGNYDVKPLGDGKYAVSTNVPGHVGACIMDEESVVKLREKYAPQGDTVSFTTKPPVEETEKEVSQKKESSTGHKLLISATNFLCPGLGQAINGDWGKAAGFAIGAPLATAGLFLACPPLGITAGIGASVAMFVDAYKNA